MQKAVIHPIYVLWLMMIMGLMLPLAAQDFTEADKINLLIQTVENSRNTFIRGGTEYTARDAASHMRMKWNRAGKSRIQSARDFIKHIASASYLLGSPYYIKFPNGRKVKSRDYMLARLAEIEAQQNSGPK